MNLILIALLIAIGSGAQGHITTPVIEPGNVVVAWDSPAPGEGWVHLEHFEDGSYRLDIQREFAPRPSRKALLRKWRKAHGHTIYRHVLEARYERLHR